MVTPQRWSALAPDFVEVEENVEYVEREDEFDIAPPEELHQRRLNREDESVDVLTLDVPLSHAHAGPAAFILPVLLDDAAAVNSDSEDDVVAVGAGQFRRKTPGRDWGAGAEGDAAAALTSGDERGGARQTVNGTGKPVNGSRRRAKAE
jgi:COMPASS component SWD1